MRDRRVYACKPEGVPGDPQHPVSDELLEAKFRDCVSFSANTIPAERVEKAIAFVRNLENLTDATEIIRLLGPE